MMSIWTRIASRWASSKTLGLTWWQAIESTPELPPLKAEELGDDANDPLSTTPLTRYNAMLAIVRNTLFMYVGPVGLMNS